MWLVRKKLKLWRTKGGIFSVIGWVVENKILINIKDRYKPLISPRRYSGHSLSEIPVIVDIPFFRKSNLTTVF